MQGAQVRSLVWELGSYVPPGRKTETQNKSDSCNRFNKEFKNGPPQNNFLKKQLKKKKKGSSEVDEVSGLDLFQSSSLLTPSSLKAAIVSLGLVLHACPAPRVVSVDCRLSLVVEKPPGVW